MLYIVETKKDVETAARELEEAVKRNKFGVLHVHDLQKTLKEKGVDFPNACKILEVCNPQRATEVLKHERCGRRRHLFPAPLSKCRPPSEGRSSTLPMSLP